MTAGQVITTANIANLTFTPVNGGTGSPYTTFPFTVTDAGGAISAAATETVNVTPTTPTTSPNTVTTLEDTAYTFAAANFPLTGPAGETLQSVTVVTLPALGTLKLSGVNVTAGQTITAANIGNLTYTPVNGGTGSPYTTFPFQVTDAGGATSAAATETVNVTPTTPTTSPNTVTTLEDTAYTFAAANFPLTGPAGETLKSVTVVTLPATGTLKLSGVNVTAGQVITAANIANLTYTPVNGGTGSPYTTFPFQVTDASGASGRRPPRR